MNNEWLDKIEREMNGIEREVTNSLEAKKRTAGTIELTFTLVTDTVDHTHRLIATDPHTGENRVFELDCKVHDMLCEDLGRFMAHLILKGQLDKLDEGTDNG